MSKVRVDTIATVDNLIEVSVGSIADLTDIAAAKARANHTGTQLASTISDFAATTRATTLTGLSTGTIAVITATDTVLSSIGKLQAQITANGSGGLQNDLFYENGKTVSANYTITTGKNAMTAGPITIADGVVVTIPNDSKWTVV